jgi:branched-chain amino acid transport system substrate-binding protein
LHTIGQVLNNRYRILNLLGQGGFGAVYRAWDANLNLSCAIKQNSETSPQASRQFAREAKILAKLRHPNLPKVTDYFTLPGSGQYLVMEYIEGEDLQTKLDKVDGPLPEARVLPWADQILDALEYLHSQDPPIIHRDIKPANIRITPQGQAVLVDFGIAKSQDLSVKTTEGVRAVTPGYSPYEQYALGMTDARSDIYALGSTLYTLLTGSVLHESVLRLIDDPVRLVGELNPALSAATSLAIQRAIRVDPRKRWPTATEFKAALHGQALQETLADQDASDSTLGSFPLEWADQQSLPESFILPDAIASASRSGNTRLRTFGGVAVLVSLVAAGILASLLFIDPFGWRANQLPTQGALAWTVYATQTAEASSATAGPVTSSAVDTLPAVPSQPDKTLRIGLLAPLSGSMPSFGVSTKEGADLAVKEWNARGGILGKNIELVILDSRCEADAALEAANQLIFVYGVRYIVGEVCSRASIPVAEIANQNKVVMVSPVSTNLAVTVDETGNTRPFTYRACFTDPFQGQVMAKFALSQGFRTAFILNAQDDEYSNGLGEAFEKTFIASGGQIVGKESYLASATDFSEILTKVIASQAEVLFVPDYYPVVNLVGRQAKDMGVRAVLMGGDGWDSPGLDRIATEGGYFTNHFDLTDRRPILVDWLRRFNAEHNSNNPNAVAALTYDAVNLMLAAIEEAGVDDPVRVADLMAEMTWAGVTGNLYFDAQHNPIKSATVLTIRQGQKAYVTTVEP